MRTETKTVRVGEYLGCVDWSYDFQAHGWDRTGGMNPGFIGPCVERLRRLEKALQEGRDFEATTDGGWPRCGWGKVVMVGMWDGWPYWKPVPSVRLSSIFGGGWHSWMAITDVRELGGKA